MPAFPRTILPIASSPFALRAPLTSFGQSGKGQMRGYQAQGRSWSEVYPPMDVRDQVVRAWLAAVSSYWHEGTILDIAHPAYQTNYGLFGGTPLVLGAGQTGLNLVIDGCTPSQSPWIRGGDVFRVAGINYLLEASANANANGAGQVTIPLVSKIYAPGPADNAALTIANVTARVILAAAPNLPTSDDADEPLTIVSGITLQFQEVG